MGKKDFFLNRVNLLNKIDGFYNSNENSLELESVFGSKSAFYYSVFTASTTLGLMAFEKNAATKLLGLIASVGIGVHIGDVQCSARVKENFANISNAIMSSYSSFRSAVADDSKSYEEHLNAATNSSLAFARNASAYTHAVELKSFQDKEFINRVALWAPVALITVMSTRSIVKIGESVFGSNVLVKGALLAATSCAIGRAMNYVVPVGTMSSFVNEQLNSDIDSDRSDPNIHTLGMNFVNIPQVAIMELIKHENSKQSSRASGII